MVATNPERGMPPSVTPRGGGLRPLARLGARVVLIGVAPLAVVAGPSADSATEPCIGAEPRNGSSEAAA
jgi:hypothetical protein